MEKLGKAADWTNLGRTFPARGGQGTVSPFEDDEQEFTVVDSRAVQKTNAKKPYVQRGAKTKQRIRGGSNWQDPGQRSKGRPTQQQPSRQQGKRGGGTAGGYRRGGGQMGWGAQSQRKSSTSVDIEPTWNDPLSVIDFNILSSSSEDIPTSETLSSYGTLRKYNNALDKLNVRQETRLERGYAAEMKFYHPTTTEDTVMNELVQQKVANVYATDSILVVLMSVLRSAYSFDIVVTKDAEGNIFFDKRDDFLFDYLTVNENSNEPPADEADPTCNSLEQLHKEHTTTNQNFAQQVLLKDGEGNEQKSPKPNPFASNTDHLPSETYNYRTFDLGDNIKLCVRTEVDAYDVISVKGVEKTRPLLIKSLIEYDQKITGGWRMKLENQKAGCFATELKTNNCKLTKWMLQAHLANVPHIKLGWISRTNPKDPFVHSILGITDHPVKEIASELGVDMHQVWGGLKYILTVLRKLSEGSYILLRDPQRKNIYIYRTQPNEFKQKKAAAK
jgi:translation initiation factor 3 subunit D